MMTKKCQRFLLGLIQRASQYISTIIVTKANDQRQSLHWWTSSINIPRNTQRPFRWLKRTVLIWPVSCTYIYFVKQDRYIRLPVSVVLGHRIINITPEERFSCARSLVKLCYKTLRNKTALKLIAQPVCVSQYYIVRVTYMTGSYISIVHCN